MPGPAYYSGQINIAKNEDWIVPFIYGTPNPNGTITPIDLTGSIIKLEIRKLEEDHEALVWAFSSPEDGVVITDFTGGAFTIVISREKMLHLATGDYVSDIVRLMPNGFQERIWEGAVAVVEGTTR